MKKISLIIILILCSLTLFGQEHNVVGDWYIKSTNYNWEKIYKESNVHNDLTRWTVREAVEYVVDYITITFFSDGKMIIITPTDIFNGTWKYGTVSKYVYVYLKYESQTKYFYLQFDRFNDLIIDSYDKDYNYFKSFIFNNKGKLRKYKIL